MNNLSQFSDPDPKDEEEEPEASTGSTLSGDFSEESGPDSSDVDYTESTD